VTLDLSFINSNIYFWVRLMVHITRAIEYRKNGYS